LASIFEFLVVVNFLLVCKVLSHYGSVFFDFKLQNQAWKYIGLSFRNFCDHVWAKCCHNILYIWRYHECSMCTYVWQSWVCVFL